MRSLFFALAGFIMISMALTACSNTFEGVGRDMQSAGQKIEETF